MTASQPKNKMDCQPQGPWGKEENSSRIWKGNELACEAARRKHRRRCMFSQNLLVAVPLRGERYTRLAATAPPSLSLPSSCPPPPRPPPCQQRCAIVSERPISIIQLMNTEWPQVVLIKKVQRLQTVCNLSLVGEGFYKKTGQRKRGEGGLESFRFPF